MKKIILKSGLTLHQKIILILVFIVTFLIGTIMLLALILKTLKFPEFEEDFIAIDYFLLFLFPLSVFFLLILLSKNGVVIFKNKDIYSAKFIFGKYWFKQKVNLTDITDISILSFKGIQKFAFVSAASPDKGYTVYNNEIHLLNEKHTTKRHLITTNDLDLAEDTVHKINETLNLNYMPYNPRFGYRRRI